MKEKNKDVYKIGAKKVKGWINEVNEILEIFAS